MSFCNVVIDFLHVWDFCGKQNSSKTCQHDNSRDQEGNFYHKTIFVGSLIAYLSRQEVNSAFSFYSFARP
jgi:hypothetical protein